MSGDIKNTRLFDALPKNTTSYSCFDTKQLH